VALLFALDAKTLLERTLRTRGKLGHPAKTSGGAERNCAGQVREARESRGPAAGEDKPTDVLSFPPVLGLADGFAGDVAISADIAAQNARRLGHSAAEEIKILVLHGVLHLAGYDHEHDHGEMARQEKRLRSFLNLPVVLIERDGEAQAKSLNRRGRGENP